MTPREFRLRLRIDALQDERDDALQRVDVLADQLKKTRQRLGGQTKSARIWKRKYDQLRKARADKRSQRVPVLILSKRYPRMKK